MKLLLLLCLGRALAHGYASDDDGVFGRKSYGLKKINPNDGDDTMIRRIEKEMLMLNKSGDPARDKRALGILLQGFMEALGYTVSPIQIASLPNPTPAAQMMPPGAVAPPPPMMMRKQSNAMPMPPPMMMANGTAPPRQRETLRLTGVLNFGNNANTTNLENHLAQYEQLFHGNRTTTSPAPPPAPPAPNIDPRARPLLPEPLFVKIPLPIAPNLPPPQPPSPMPFEEDNFENEYSKEHSEEYVARKDEEGQHGSYEEESDGHQNNEEYANKHEQYHEPEDRTYDEGESAEQPEPPREKNVEKEYKNNKSVESYRVQNKEIHDPKEVSEEVPGSKFNHAIYVGEPNWKQEQEANVYRIAAEQEAQAEALAEANAEREKNRANHECASEEDEKFHRSREKEINDRNEENAARYEESSREEPYSEEEEDPEATDQRQSGEEEDDEEEPNSSSDVPASDSQRLETPTTEGVVKEREEVTEKPANRRYQKYEDVEEISPQQIYKNQDYEPPRRHFSTLPISSDREHIRQDQALRDSYGKVLAKPGNKVDDRVADYLTSFKDPQTGVYDPNRIQQYDISDLVKGFKNIQEEYGAPESKYEEYAIDDNDDDEVEHRAESVEKDKSEIQAKKDPPDANCDCCGNKPKDGHSSEETRSRVESVNTPAPTPYTNSDEVSYGPYYSTVKYLYEPRNRDANVISRLISHDPPKPDSRADLLDKPSRHSPQRQLIQPAEEVRPETLIPTTLHPENVVKEIRAWPAPFDYVYDDTEHTDVFVKQIPYPYVDSAANTRLPGFTNSHLPVISDNNYYDVYSMPTAESAHKMQVLPKDVPKSNKDTTRRPEGFKENVTQRPRSRQAVNKTSSRQPTSPQRLAKTRTYTPRTPESRASSAGAVQFVTSQPRSRNSTRPTRRPVRTRPTRTTTVKPPTTKQKYDDYPALRDTNSREESSNYVEKDGMLIIPEPTPYNYDERVDEFKDEPQSDTEKVNIKEYRNRIESFKLSKLKQPHLDISR